MAKDERKASVKNVAETPWRQYPDHFGGALSKPLAAPDSLKTKHLDYRISMYQPMAYVKVHSHKVQEQVYHVSSYEDGWCRIDAHYSPLLRSRTNLYPTPCTV